MRPVINVNDGYLSIAIGQLSDTWKQAAATAINLTVDDVLAAQRAKMQQVFHIRVPAFDLPPQQLPASWRATPSRLWARVALGSDDGPTSIGGKRVSIFSKYGVAQTKTGSLTQPIAIPTEALRPSIGDLVPIAMYPKNLRLAQRMQPDGSLLGIKALGTQRKQTITRGSLKLRQQDRTFILPNSFGTRAWGIWERIGPGHADIRKIWNYADSIPIPKRLSFEDDARAMIAERYPINWDGAFERSLAGTLWRRAR